jgi:hypothetical protein
VSGATGLVKQTLDSGKIVICSKHKFAQLNNRVNCSRELSGHNSPGVTIGSIAGDERPTLPSGWALVATADFNSDGHPYYVLYRSTSRQTAIWFLNNNILVSGAVGPTLPAGWSVVGAADFNGNINPGWPVDVEATAT